MNLEEVIRNIITAFLAICKKRVLIFLSRGTVNVEVLFRYLKDCEFNNYDIVISDNAKEFLGEDLVAKLPGRLVKNYRELEESVQENDLVLIPLLSRNTLCKVALGIEDNLLTTGIAMSIMQNKEIIAVRDSYDPQNPINVYKGFNKNPAYNAMLLDYENTLKKYGVKVVNYDEFLALIKQKVSALAFDRTFVEGDSDNKNRPAEEERLAELRDEIITVADLNKLRVNDKINIGQTTKITPLARDYIEKNNISVEFSGDK